MKLFLPFIFTLVNMTLESKEDYIIWSKDTKINWSAFKAKPDKTSPFAAMSAVGIYYKYYATVTDKFVTVKFEIDSRFDKTKSWSKEHWQSENMLKHEQLHFDICELVKRKFKKEAENTIYTTNYKNEIIEIFNKYSAFLQKLQQKYDEQTQHSENKAKQKSWENLLQQELLK